MKGAETKPCSGKISIRLNDEDAVRFSDTCTGLGIPPSTAIRVFVSAFIRHGGFPFPICETPVATYMPHPGGASYPDSVACDPCMETRTYASDSTGTVTYTEGSE